MYIHILKYIYNMKKGNRKMNKDYGDMYQYILESKQAVRNIISNHEKNFKDDVE